MYHFNYRLMENLPFLLGKTQKEVVSEMGTIRETFIRWQAGEIPCRTLAALCNRYRISLSSFIVLKEDTPLLGRASDYVFPSEAWKPVSWDSAPLGRLFGKDGSTGITKVEAAGRLGFASYQIFDRWADTPGALRVSDLLRLLNEFHLDASLFFKDGNRPVPLPEWTVAEVHVADILKERMEGYRRMEGEIEEKNRIIHSLRGDKDRLSRENLQLRTRLDRALTEGPALFRQKEYTFHQALWDSLPEMFGMSYMDFCAKVGINYRGSYVNTNLKVTALVAACNLFRISPSHFFLPKGEVAVVQDAGYYSISPSLFTPVEDRMENLKYLFGRTGVTGYSIDELGERSVGRKGFAGMAVNGGTARVLTLCDICSSFHIPPYIFFHDENRKKASFSYTRNEELLLNAITLARECESLKKDIRRLRDRLENKA